MFTGWIEPFHFFLQGGDVGAALPAALHPEKPIFLIIYISYLFPENWQLKPTIEAAVKTSPPLASDIKHPPCPPAGEYY